MKLEPAQVAAALDQIAEHIAMGASSAREYEYTNDEFAKGSAEWNLDLAYTELLVLAELLDLPLLRADVRDVVNSAAGQIIELKTDPQGEPYAKWAVPARRFVRAMQAVCVIEPARTVTKDIASILRAATYSITNRDVFADVPQSEADVHNRVEAVLKCLFPGLQRKPRLGKPIKNFEPDTGLPSIQTLVEFKYISGAQQVSNIADEILADTRGYTSEDWTTFIYAVYETTRFRSEAEWNQMLRACGVPDNASVIVMSGEPRQPSPKPPIRRRPSSAPV